MVNFFFLEAHLTPNWKVVIHLKVSSSSLLSICYSFSVSTAWIWFWSLGLGKLCIVYSFCLPWCGLEPYFPSSIRDHFPYRAHSLLFFPWPPPPRIITHEKAQGPSPLAVVIFCFSIDCGLLLFSSTRLLDGSTVQPQRWREQGPHTSSPAK